MVNKSSRISKEEKNIKTRRLQQFFMEKVRYEIFLKVDILNECWSIQIEWKKHSNIFLVMEF